MAYCTFGSKIESDNWLELVEEGSADTIEGKAVDEAAVEEWVPTAHACPVSFGVRLSKQELAALEEAEELEEVHNFLVIGLALGFAMS